MTAAELHKTARLSFAIAALWRRIARDWEEKAVSVELLSRKK